MKVVHVIPSFARRDGGPSELLRGLLPALVDRGVDVSLVTTDKGAVRDDYDLTVQIPSRVARSLPPRSFTFAPGIIGALNRELPTADLVHVHSVNSFPSTVAMTMARFRKIPYLLEPHGAFDRNAMANGRLKKRLYNSTIDRIGLTGVFRLLVSSEREREHSRDIMTVEAMEMPLGVPEALFDMQRLSADQPQILFLGRLARVKRIDLVLRALADERLIDEQWRLIVAGPIEADLPYSPVQLAEELGISHRIEWLGRVDGDKRNELLMSSDILVAPSEAESFGMAVAEAMAAGCAVVASNHVGIAPKASRVGALISTSLDPAEVATGISALLASETARRRMGSIAREYARESFTWQTAARVAHETYEMARSAQ